MCSHYAHLLYWLHAVTEEANEAIFNLTADDIKRKNIGIFYLSAREVHIDVMDCKPTNEVHNLGVVIIGVLQCFPTSYHIVK